jgi:hypothetical protein
MGHAGIEQVGCALVRLDTLPSNGSEINGWHRVNRLENAAGLSTLPQVLTVAVFACKLTLRQNIGNP